MRKQLITLRLARMVLVVASILLVSGGSYAGGDKPGEKKGWIEGTVVSQNGSPLRQYIYVHKDGKLLPGAIGQFGHATTDTTAGGFFRVNDLDAGVYEVWIKHSSTSGTTEFCPQRYLAVEVKSGARTVLKATMKKGQELEEIGKVDVPTAKVESVMLELERLQKDVATLKKENEALKKEVEALKKR